MQLEQEGGLAVVRTHFGKGFLRDGQVHPQIVELLTQLSRRQGWFPPVSTLLDYVSGIQGGIPLFEGYKLFRLEGLWFWHSTPGRRNRRTYEVTETPYLRRAIALRTIGLSFSRDESVQIPGRSARECPNLIQHEVDQSRPGDCQYLGPLRNHNSGRNEQKQQTQIGTECY